MFPLACVWLSTSLHDWQLLGLSFWFRYDCSYSTSPIHQIAWIPPKNLGHHPSAGQLDALLLWRVNHKVFRVLKSTSRLSLFSLEAMVSAIHSHLCICRAHKLESYTNPSVPTTRIKQCLSDTNCIVVYPIPRAFCLSHRVLRL